MNKRILYLALIVLVVGSMMLGACKPKAPELGTEENPIIWAVVPSGETERVVAGFEQVSKILFDETGLVVKPLMTTEYAGVIEALASDPPKAHMASLATFAYILAAEKGVAQAELVAERFGSAVYNGQIFTRKDSGLNTIADLKGKSFCRPDPLSTSGWIIPNCLIESDNSSNASSSKFFLGCSLFGSTAVIFTILSGAASSFSFPSFLDSGISESNPFPSPLPFTAAISILLF